MKLLPGVPLVCCVPLFCRSADAIKKMRGESMVCFGIVFPNAVMIVP